VARSTEIHLAGLVPRTESSEIDDICRVWSPWQLPAAKLASGKRSALARELFAGGRDDASRGSEKVEVEVSGLPTDLAPARSEVEVASAEQVAISTVTDRMAVNCPHEFAIAEVTA
jgi:hypothetical protein